MKKSLVAVTAILWLALFTLSSCFQLHPIDAVMLRLMFCDNFRETVTIRADVRTITETVECDGNKTHSVVRDIMIVDEYYAETKDDGSVTVYRKGKDGFTATVYADQEAFEAEVYGDGEDDFLSNLLILDSSCYVATEEEGAYRLRDDADVPGVTDAVLRLTEDGGISLCVSCDGENGVTEFTFTIADIGKVSVTLPTTE